AQPARRMANPLQLQASAWLPRPPSAGHQGEEPRWELQLAAYAAELRAQGLSFSVRMGLNSGEVVVGAIGEDLGMEYTAVGHTVGLAQRMEQLAAADRVYLTQHTASLVEGYLALADLGEFQVRGASRPLRVHELIG